MIASAYLKAHGPELRHLRMAVTVHFGDVSGGLVPRCQHHLISCWSPKEICIAELHEDEMHASCRACVMDQCAIQFSALRGGAIASHRRCEEGVHDKAA